MLGSLNVVYLTTILTASVDVGLLFFTTGPLIKIFTALTKSESLNGTRGTAAVLYIEFCSAVRFFSGDVYNSQFIKFSASKKIDSPFLFPTVLAVCRFAPNF